MPSTMFRRYDSLLLVLSAGLVLLYLTVASHGFPLDDSWIHQVYGRNLAQTGEWAFVPGQPSAASTSPLYTVLLSIGYRLNLPYAVWTHGLGAITLFAASIIAGRMAERVLVGVRYAGLAAGVAVALSWHLVWAAVSGMETMLFSMFTLVLIGLAWAELDERSPKMQHVAMRGAVFGVIAALATLTRPEGVMLAGLIGAAMLLVRPQSGLRAVMVWGVAAAGAFLIVVAPYLTLNVQLTGGLLPDTAAAKQAQLAPLLEASYFQRVFDLFVPIFAGGQILLLPGLVVYSVTVAQRLRDNRRDALYLLPVIWGVALVMLYAARLPAPYQHGRYVIPALASLVVAGVVGSLWLVRVGRRSLVGRVLSRGLAAAAFLLFVVYAVVIGPRTYARDVQNINSEMVASAVWIAENIPPDDLLAIHDIGAVGYFTPRPIFDIAGLVNPEVIPVLLDEEALWGLMRQNDAQYLLAFPNQVPGQDVRDDRLCPLHTPANPSGSPAEGYHMTIYRLSWDGVCL